MISMIVAVAESGVIGKDGKIPWYLPEDLKYFRKITTGHTVVMGRKTHDSIGKPLPSRRNIVLTSNPQTLCAGVESAARMSEVIAMCSRDEKVFIIGGAQVYDAFMPYADDLYVTEIKGNFEGDTRFDFPRDQFAERSRLAGAGLSWVVYTRQAAVKS